jgi:hypothetical protein
MHLLGDDDDRLQEVLGMTQPTLPPMLCDTDVFAYCSSAPVDARVAARLVEAIRCPVAKRDWAAPPPCQLQASESAPSRFLFGEVWIDRRASAAYSDVLWLIGQLARIARDEHLEFEVQIGAMKGRVSTGGVDAGAQQILFQAQGASGGKTLRPRQHRRRPMHSRTG